MATHRLADAQWRPAPFDDVVRCFLESEIGRFARYFDLTDGDDVLITSILNSPTAPETSALRRALLGLIRFGLFHHVPPTTQWFSVTLDGSNLDELRVAARCGWDAASDRNELRRVAERCERIETIESPEYWKPIVIWAHDPNGPFVILEGTHRMLAYAMRPDLSGTTIKAFAGLSPDICNWHPLDPRHLGYPRHPLMLRQDSNVYRLRGYEHRSHMGY
jgi:hypothetical protein